MLKVLFFSLICKIEYGVILTIVQSKESLEGMCLIQKLEKMWVIDGTVMLTEFNCPILTLTPHLFLVSPSHICKPVSIVHICLNTCQMIISSFVHDFNNKMFCFNIFCTGNY